MDNLLFSVPSLRDSFAQINTLRRWTMTTMMVIIYVIVIWFFSFFRSVWTCNFLHKLRLVYYAVCVSYATHSATGMAFVVSLSLQRWITTLDCERMKNSYWDALPFAALLFAWCACDMMALESYVSFGIAPTVTNGEFKWAMNMSSVSGSVRGDKTNAWGMEINAFRSNYSRLYSTIFLHSKCWWTWISDISPCSLCTRTTFNLGNVLFEVFVQWIPTDHLLE